MAVPKRGEFALIRDSLRRYVMVRKVGTLNGVPIFGMKSWRHAGAEVPHELEEYIKAHRSFPVLAYYYKDKLSDT